MGESTKIQWAHHTFNPWWGCTKVSQGCKHCYAEGQASRYGTAWGPLAQRRIMADSTWQQPVQWNKAAGRAGERHRVFCASMADAFEDNEQLTEARSRLWQLIEQTPHLDWLLLTKRPENIMSMVPGAWLLSPRHNVWYGTSAERQAEAQARVPVLASVPAVIRFLSCEPLLEPVSLQPWLASGSIHWVITGGESGSYARHAQPEWFRAIRSECQAAGVAFFHKQNGGRDKSKGGELLDGRLWHGMPAQRELEQTVIQMGLL